MSDFTGLKETGELLHGLREGINAFAAREKALLRSLSSAATGQARTFETATEEENARFEQAMARADEIFRSRSNHLNGWAVQRETRIRKAHTNAKRQAAERIEHEKGRAMYALQQGRLATAREKDEALRANDANYWEFNANMENARGLVAGLRKKAAASFRGYLKFQGFLKKAPDPFTTSDDAGTLVESFNELYQKVAGDLARFRKLPIPLFFGMLPLWVLLIAAVLAVGAQAMLAPQSNLVLTGAMAGGVLVLLFIIAEAGKGSATPLAREIAAGLGLLGQVQQAAQEAGARQHQAMIEEIESGAAQRLRTLEGNWKRASTEAEGRRESTQQALDAKSDRLAAWRENMVRARLENLNQHHAAELAQLQGRHEETQNTLVTTREARAVQQAGDNQARWHETEAEWAASMPPRLQMVRAAVESAAKFPEWNDPVWAAWKPARQFGDAVPFGRLEVDLPEACEALPQDPRLPLDCPAQFSVPALLTFPHRASILFETSRSCGETVAGTLNSVILRLLSQSPAGRLNFTILDPVGLGQNFASVMHLADYEDSLINNRIWTQASEIEQRLSDLNKHIEKVIQLYLRNEYATIREYNERAGNIAEKYHFLVIADFPVNFSETAMRHLANIAVSGARCGVYTLIHWDKRHDQPPPFVLDELRKNSICVVGGQLPGITDKGVQLKLDQPPAPEMTTEFLHKVGAGWKDSNRVEVPFAHIAPEPAEMWSLDTAEELRVPIGRAGATKLQYLAIGRGTRQHTLIGGKTGSGKSTLFHVVVTNLALWCNPEQVEFYLVDFKKGVEFKCYGTHKLPHARVIAIESDREFGLGVLQRVDEELKRRGELFRKLGVQNLSSYREAGGEPLPRTLLMIDEFQEYFVQDDRVSQDANMLLDRLVRQGRAFGIHVILGSQTLGGAYTLARATMGQMVIRIALQCNEADAQLIMDDDNPAPRLLTRPGEGIYNDMAGAKEGNSPFQTVWLSEEERDACLEKIAQRAGGDRPAPFVFEGNAPADIRDNRPLRKLIESTPARVPSAARIWLGDPNAIKGPTEAIFHRQGGNNLLLVGQGDESVLALLTAGLVSLAAQYPREGAKFVVFDSSAPDSVTREYLQRVAAAIPQETTLARASDLAPVMAGLHEELKRRSDQPEDKAGPAIFLFFPGLQNFKKLRQEDDFSFSSGDEDASPAKIFADILADGAAVGIHVIAACDTYNNVMRYIGRKPLTEFEMRVLFQMSANDSASLIDSPRAGSLGLHRALIHNAQEGYMELFRPYSLPEGTWVDEVGALLRAGRPQEAPLET